MRILWWSNAPWASTGYGVQTKLFAPRLAKAGHQLAIAALYGLQGGPITWNGIQCFPGLSEIGQEAIGHHSESWNADITIGLFDAWPFEPQFFRNSGMRWVPWFPVDMEPLAAQVQDRVQQAFASIVFSKFGERMCQKAGLVPFYVPHGVDLEEYQPIPRAEARKALGCPEDRFVVGMVAANKDYPSRKALPQVIEAFARFAKRHSDALLYLHTKCNDEPLGSGAINIRHLIKHFELKDRVITADPYHLSMGYGDKYMAQIYSALDCLASPSLGEGFGVPILEAQACGCPVLVGDWTSMGELCFAGYKIPRERSEPFWTGLNSFFQLPHVAAIEDGLEALFRVRGDAGLRQQARRGAEAYGVDLIVEKYWQPVLTAVQEKIRGQNAKNKKAALLLESLPRAPQGTVVEIGSTRTIQEIASDGFSTVYLARACKERGVEFRSFDLDPMTVDKANRILGREGLSQCVACGDGAIVLKELDPVAFLYLDSSDDPEDTLSQFTAAPLAPGAIVVVDDAQSNGVHPFGKASRLVSLFAEHGVKFEIRPTEPGYAALVACFPCGKRKGLSL